MTIAFSTLGCKVNQYETEILMELFANSGYELVSPQEPADVYVLNSCTVTATGDQKTRQMLSRFRRQNPAAILVLTGCMPQASPEEAQNLLEADVITGSSNRNGLPALVEKAISTGVRVIDIQPHTNEEAFEPMQAGNFHGKTRAFLKIQDGCRSFCTYCIIPTARGSLRSKPLSDLKKEVSVLVKKGFQEIVLVGINLSSYGLESGHRLIEAIEETASVKGTQRVRLGSMEPERLTQEDFSRMAALPSFCPQFHLSLQSGSSTTLQRMNRGYDAAEYRKIVQSIRDIFPNPSITTDIMVGFPGETEEEFLESLAFLKEMKFAKTHVFSYSRRPGTKADTMEGQIDPAVKNIRSKQMTTAAIKTRNAFLSTQLGQVCHVLVEHEKNGFYRGYSENYTPVQLKGPDNLEGKIIKCLLISQTADGCIGEFLSTIS